MPGVELDGLRIRDDAPGEGDPLLIVVGRLAASTRGLIRTKGRVPRHRKVALPTRVGGEGEHGKDFRWMIRGLLRE
jgi:hypothetical protein